MSSSSELVLPIIVSSNTKLTALESTLNQSIGYCQDLRKQFEQLCIEAEDYKKQFIVQKEKCESKHCNGSEELKRDIECKNNIIQSVASNLTKLYETKNFNILNDVFKILCGDKTVNVPNIEHVEIKDNIKKEILTPKKEVVTQKQVFFTPKKEVFSPLKEVCNLLKADVSIKDDSVSEIEGTPTGRTSPIIQSRKVRNGSTASSTDQRDKKKCPDNWPTPDNKAIKLTFPSPSTRGKGRLRQSRLNLIKMKSNTVIDLTCSPEHMTRSSHSESFVQALVKKESTDNDDTILPSPTSGPNNFIFKSSSVISPVKLTSTPLCHKSNPEVQKSTMRCDIENTPTKNVINKINEQAEDSINLLKPIKFMSVLNEDSPIIVKLEDEDETHCEIPSSLSILQHVDMLEQKQDAGEKKKAICPSKVPLAENKNIINVPCEDTESSMSLLRQVLISPTEDKTKRQLSCKKATPAEPLYKEQLPRTKAEKRKLRGWNCDECKNFYDELYKDDPEMLAKKMDECSKHRGKNNPARPKTPEGFWNPRWSVPNDTEEFNRRNNAD